MYVVIFHGPTENPIKTVIPLRTEATIHRAIRVCIDLFSVTRHSIDAHIYQEDKESMSGWKCVWQQTKVVEPVETFL